MFLVDQGDLLAMGYAFRHEENWELGLDLGINFTSVKQSIHVSGSVVGDADLPSIDVDEPLPTLGVFFNYALSSKLYWTSRAGAFAFDVGDIDGTIYELIGGVEFRPWEHAGLGLSYMFNSADITVTDAGQPTDVEWEYKGPILYLVAGF